MTLADAFDAFLMDLDGVVWRGDRPVPKAAETIAALRERGKRVVFVTNNSSRTAREYAVKLMRMKIPVPTTDVVTSGHAVVAELRERGFGEGDRIHVCGGEGLIRLLTHERFVVTTDSDEHVKALVVGFHPGLGFEDLRKAADLARAGVPFIASNADPTYPAEDGLLPGTGALIAAIRTASGAEPVVVGKPQPRLFRLALERTGTEAERALVCGDRAETDVAGARAAGIPSALVLTGITRESDLGGLRDLPDLVLDSVADLTTPIPMVRIDVRDDGVVVASGAEELAGVTCTRNGKRTILRSLELYPALDRSTGWWVVRRLLLTALQGAEEVEAAPELRPYLERIGVDIDPQQRLFTT